MSAKIDQDDQDLIGPSPNRIIHTDTLDARSLALLRCMIAVTILLTPWISPAEHPISKLLVYASYAAYCIYSIFIALISYRFRWRSPPRALYWFDVYCFTWLVALTYPNGNALYQCFFYPIFVASFTKGFREGFFLALVAFFLYLIIGFAYAFPSAELGFGHSNTLVRSDYILVVGYMIAYCGGYGGLFMRKLALLKEINSHWHPRIGVDQVYGSNLDRLLDFFNGNMCILVLQREDHGPSYIMYTASRDKPGQTLVQHDVAEGAANALLNNIPAALAAYYRGHAEPFWLKFREHHAYDIISGIKSKSFQDECAALANLLDTKAFVTVPYLQHGAMDGRIFLTSRRGGFTNSDVDFLLQVSSAISTVVESMNLVEELITKAAEQERSNISRDLHDTTIQPYIGLKLALEALSREATEDNPLSPRIHELIEMAEMTVEDLRDFAATIKGRGAMPGDAMVAAITTQAERLHRFYGINVKITSDITSQLKGRLAAEAFQIVSEGLSNILRHTKAKNAYVSVLCTQSSLQLEIVNDEGEEKEFTPRSIDERVQSLNGRTWVEYRTNCQTAVAVSIPL